MQYMCDEYEGDSFNNFSSAKNIRHFGLLIFNYSFSC